MESLSAYNTIEHKGGKTMKFVKGMVIGGIVTAGIAMMYAETMDQSKKRMMKKGKQFARRMGIV